MSQDLGRMNRGYHATSYYMPYDSGTDDDDEGSEPSLDPSSESDHEDARMQDPRYAILKTAGPRMDTSEKQLQYMSHLPGAPWDKTTNITSFKDHVYLDPPKTIKTSLVSIKSSNRDKSVYPTPFQFQLKLPRVYKNITKFQLVQMSFPNNSNNVASSDLFQSSFIKKLVEEGVPVSCLSTCVSVINCTTSATGLGMIEMGRINEQGNPLLVTVSVPNGSYNDNQLAGELTFRANSTPPMNIISYDTFHDIFQNTRDITPLFNEPGDNYYSNINHSRFGTHTKDHIMSSYYTQQHLDSLPEITDTVTFNAYYYPVLKEMLATGLSQPFLLTGMYTYEEIYQRVMGSFEGLTSPFYEEIEQWNQGTLDSYRRHLTFELRNVNKYRWSYQASSQKMITVHDSLHTSIQRDLTKYYNNLLQQELSMSGLNAHSFRTLKTNLVSYQSVYKHLERNLSSVLGNYHFSHNYQYTGGDLHITQESTFHAVQDLQSDIQFDTMFQYQSTIGRIYGNYVGIPMTFYTFADYHSSLSSYYMIAQSTNTAIQSIQSHVNMEYHTYVSTKYAGILPEQMISTQSYQSYQSLPVSFVTNQYSYTPGQNIIQNQVQNIFAAGAPQPPAYCLDTCCHVINKMISSWYSSLPVNFTINTLQYRLGLINTNPMSFNIFSTVKNLTSTGTNMNFFLQINNEQGFNNIDVTMPENYMISHEATGQVKLMSGKILMGDVGDTGVSQTVIQNPSVFENHLGKLDRLDFKIYYDDNQITPAWLYMPYYLDINEWNATFQIDEEIGFANQASGWGSRPTIPIPDDPDHTPYIHITHKDNPNNS